MVCFVYFVFSKEYANTTNNTSIDTTAGMCLQSHYIYSCITQTDVNQMNKQENKFKKTF